MVKNLPDNVGEMGLILGSERSPAEGNGNTLQFPNLRVPQTEETGVLQFTWSQNSWTRLSN